MSKKIEKTEDQILLKVSKTTVHGAAVKRLQEFLSLLGVFNDDIDGIFGTKTQDSVKAFQEKAKLKVDGVVGDKTWVALVATVDDLSKETSSMQAFMETLDRVHDIRKMHSPPRLASKKTPKRPWGQIKGVTIHQTGCNMPKKPQAWSRLNAHFGVTREGMVVFANDPTMMIWHAQGLSRETIGIEIEGNYPGLMNDPSTLWKGGGPENTLNPEMHAALEQLFTLIQWFFDRNGKRWEKIHAHRQAYKSRCADPGEEIWRSVALPWMDRLNKIGPFDEDRDGGDTFCIGDGRRIPLEWAPGRRTCPYVCPPRKG